jgi:hypothetical protein
VLLVVFEGLRLPQRHRIEGLDDRRVIRPAVAAGCFGNAFDDAR